MKAKLLALRAEVDDLIARIDEDDDVSPPSPWMTVKEYAAHARVSYDIALRWVHGGLRDAKGAVVGVGKLTRIHRDLADAWRASR